MVCTKTTGHAEAIEVEYDKEVTSYRDLLEFFFQIHDPTTLDRQGNDIGDSYRSEIFALSTEQEVDAHEIISEINESGRWPGRVVTKVSKATDFGKQSQSIRTICKGIPEAIPAISQEIIGNYRNLKPILIMLL